MPKEYTLIGGNGTRVAPLEVTESGTYEAGDSRAFNPVKVNVPSGSSTLSGLTDVDINNPADGQTLVYDAASGKWVNGSGGGGGFTLLQGTYTTPDEIQTVTLAITASDLFALMQTSSVSVAWTASGAGWTASFIYPIGGGRHTVEDGDSTYFFTLDVYQASALSASDTVVFTYHEK